MQRMERMLSAGPYELANDVFNLILVKLIQKDIQSPSGRSFYKNDQWQVRAKYCSARSFMTEGNNYALDAFAGLVQQNMNSKVYSKLEPSLKTKIVNMLANELLILLDGGRYIVDVGATYDYGHGKKTIYYYFDIKEQNYTEFQQKLTAQLQGTFAIIATLLHTGKNNDMPLPPVPAGETSVLLLPELSTDVKSEPAPAARGLKK